MDENPADIEPFLSVFGAIINENVTLFSEKVFILRFADNDSQTGEMFAVPVDFLEISPFGRGASQNDRIIAKNARNQIGSVRHDRKILEKEWVFYADQLPQFLFSELMPHSFGI